MEESDTKWAEVDLSAISQNAALVKALVGPQTAVMAVVKANAYGHGAIPAARAALRGGAGWLAVSSVPEGLELRAAGIEAPILNMGYTPPTALAGARDAGLSVTLYDVATLEALRRLPAPRPVAVHVKVDTGMHRLGASPDHAIALARGVLATPHLRLEGLWTHFADADGPELQFTRDQLAAFLLVRDAVRADGAPHFISHAANSAALLRVPESRLDLVRPGLVLYGIVPAPGKDPIGVRPALRWYTRVTHVHTVPTGGTVGYGRAFSAPMPTRIATLAAGYADGLQRRLSNRGKAILGGRLAPIVGTISMDQAAADVTAIPGVAVGDVACLIGSEGSVRWEAADAARASDTIPYEVLCAISARVPRRYRGI